MKCEQIEQLITLRDVSTIDLPRKKAISTHLENCGECAKKYSDTEQYENLIRIYRENPELIENHEEFADQVIANLDSNYSSSQANQYRKIIIGLRIVASLIILLAGILYFQQKKYINNSVAALEEQYYSNPKQKAFYAEYLECRETSMGRIREIIMNDNGFITLLNKKEVSPGFLDVKKASSFLCQHSLDIEAATMEYKLQLLQQYLN